MINQDKKEILIICCILFIQLHLFALIRCFLLKYNIDINILGYNKDNNKLLNGWAFTHFFLYLLLGYFYPNEYLFLIIIGIIWEIYEYLYSIDKIFLSKIYKYFCGKDGIYLILYNPYDPFINTVGCLFGVFLQSYLNNIKTL